MKKYGVLVLILVLGWFLSTGLAPASENLQKGNTAEKRAILLVAFGTSIPEARQAFDNIEKKVKEAFSGVEVRWAFTSRIIRKKLAREGQVLFSPAQALANLMAEGYTRVAVQSLHTIRGSEYDDLKKTTGAFAHMPEGFDGIVLGEPLLSSQEDLSRAADAILSMIPASRKSDEAVVLMGHGSHHPANAFYAALMWQVQQKDPRVFIGTVAGFPTIKEILPIMVDNRVKTAWLIPFMAVAGDHARNDMAGEEQDSWKSVIEKRGIETRVVLKGTARYDSFVNIWVDHLRDALDKLQ